MTTNTHQTIFILLSALLIIGIFNPISARESENIYALTKNSKKIMVDIIGKEPRGENQFDFFIQIGNNYHRVTDCGDGQELAQMLNTHLDGVGFSGEKTLQYALELKPRPDLSCHSSRPAWLEKPVYLRLKTLILTIFRLVKRESITASSEIADMRFTRHYFNLKIESGNLKPQRFKKRLS